MRQFLYIAVAADSGMKIRRARTLRVFVVGFLGAHHQAHRLTSAQMGLVQVYLNQLSGKSLTPAFSWEIEQVINADVFRMLAGLKPCRNRVDLLG